MFWVLSFQAVLPGKALKPAVRSIVPELPVPLPWLDDGAAAGRLPQLGNGPLA